MEREEQRESHLFGCLLILTNVPTSHAQQLKWGDPNYKLASEIASDIGWYQVTDTEAWTVKDGATLGLKGARCMATLDKLRAAGVPDTATVVVKYDAPEFKRGPHSLAEIRTSCAHLETLGKIKYFERWAKFAMADTPYLSKGTYNVSYFKNCLQAVAFLIMWRTSVLTIWQNSSKSRERTFRPGTFLPSDTLSGSGRARQKRSCAR